MLNTPSKYAISPERADEIRNSPTTPFRIADDPADPGSTQGIPTDMYNRLHDHAKDILTPAPITQDQKAGAWDHFHTTKSSAELTGRLHSLPLPEDLKQQLVNAKKYNDPVPTHVDKIITAIHRMAAMDPRLLDLAEKNKTVFKYLTDVANQEEK